MFILNPYIFGGFDPDAQAFITAATITDSTQKSAINQLVLDLKSANIWTKMKAIYPFVGGSASQHKWNLKDPRDLDAAFRLQFVNGWTHSPTGAKGDGTGGHAYTFFNPSLHGLLNSHHLSFYSRTNTSRSEVEVGMYDYPNCDFMQINSTSTSLSIINQLATNAYPQFTDTNSLGYYISNRNAINSSNMWKNGVLRNSVTSTSSSLLNGGIYLSAINNIFGSGSASNYSLKECAFATIGQGLSDTEASNVYLAVQKYQTALSRQV
jgi:hypothetical protein